MKNINSEKLNTGYTIIETMIAVALFLVIVTAGMGALLNANLLHNKSQNMRSIIDNLSFVVEDMSRNLRTGYSYHCGEFVSIDTPQSCSQGGRSIFFEEAHANAVPAVDTDQWGYKIDPNDGGLTFNISKSIDGGRSWTPLNPPEVLLDSTSLFTVLGAEPPPTDSLQPFVTIKLSGTVKFQNISSPFSLQTAVSQRKLDR